MKLEKSKFSHILFYPDGFVQNLEAGIILLHSHRVDVRWKNRSTTAKIFNFSIIATFRYHLGLYVKNPKAC